MTRADWIWCREPVPVNAYLDFSDSFYINDAGRPCKILLSADTQYALYLNGEFVDCGQYGDYEHYLVYDTVDLTGKVRAGENSLMITCYRQGEDSFSYQTKLPGLIFAVLSGDEALLLSSERTLCRRNPHYFSGEMERTTPQLSFSFEYSDRPLPGAEPLTTAVNREKSKTLHPRPIEKLILRPEHDAVLLAQGDFREGIDDGEGAGTVGHRMQRAFLRHQNLHEWTGIIGPVSLPAEDGLRFELDDSGSDGIWLLADLGENCAGLLSLRLSLDSDAEILVGWGEHLDDQRVRSSIGGRSFAVRYSARAGEVSFLHPFRRIGGRYIQLHIYSRAVTVKYFGIRPTDYPVPTDNRFSTADHLHNKIYDVSLRTLQLCMHEHYEDCPWREQALYAMDSRNQMLCGYYAFGEFAFAKASLRLLGLSIRDDDQLEICAPASFHKTIPSFTAIYPVQLWEYFLFSGDAHFAAEMLPAARRIVDSFLAHIDCSGLIPRYPSDRYWNFYEWEEGLSGGEETPDGSAPIYDAPLAMFVILAADATAKILRHLGDTDAASRYSAAADRLRKAVHTAYWQPESACYASFLSENRLYHHSELVQALAVCSGVAGSNTDAVLETMVSGKLVPVTLSFSIFKYDALLTRPEKYAAAVFGDVAEVWGKMLYSGATTFWETAKGAWDFYNAGSLCHGWSSVPVYLYGAYGLGLKPLAPGFAETEIRPVCSGIPGISGEFRFGGNIFKLPQA